jgi:hypothetical protein
MTAAAARPPSSRGTARVSHRSDRATSETETAHRSGVVQMPHPSFPNLAGGDCIPSAWLLSHPPPVDCPGRGRARQPPRRITGGASMGHQPRRRPRSPCFFSPAANGPISCQRGTTCTRDYQRPRRYLRGGGFGFHGSAGSTRRLIFEWECPTKGWCFNSSTT